MLNSNAMVKKPFVTANEVCNEIQARFPKDLWGSAFHYLAYIKKLFHEKHLFYKMVKNFMLRSGLSNFQTFCNNSKEYWSISIILLVLRGISG
jgi:hypothetical protein